MRLRAALLAALCLLASAPAAAASAPRLGRVWGYAQEGYGEVRPSTVYNGGDPTGLVTHVRWKRWGTHRAIGSGTSTYVWPGTAVADNPPVRGARLVAFHLGRCHGVLAYKAIEWVYPAYGESFDPHQYIDICNGKYVGTEEKPRHCPGVALSDGSGRTGRLEVRHMSCDSARELAAATPGQYIDAGGRYVQSGFRCGTQGVLFDSALFECSLGERWILYWVSPSRDTEADPAP